MKKKIILTTGGTGGHIYPAIAVAKVLEKKGIEVLFLGTIHRMEKELIPDLGYRFIGMDILPLRSIKSVYKMIKAIFKTIKILRKENPDAVIGFGNYISIPTLLAALFLRKSIYLQEQNANLGMANKLFYRFAKKTFLAFEKTFDELPIKYQDRLLVTGNPLREEFYQVNREEERDGLKVEEDEKVLLVTGGSLGAKSINCAMLKKWEDLLKEKNIRVYWATGKNNFEEINNKISKMKSNDVIKPYFNNMCVVMSVADMVICRAGALTISELVQLEKPSILVPLQIKGVGQYYNAQILEEKDSALIYKNNQAEYAIEKALELLKDEKRLADMRSKIKFLKKGNAAERIVDELNIWGNN